MRARPALIFAVSLSIGIHAGAALVPHLRVPETARDPMRLEARLLQLPPQGALEPQQPPPKPKPRPSRPPSVTPTTLPAAVTPPEASTPPVMAPESVAPLPAPEPETQPDAVTAQSEPVAQAPASDEGGQVLPVPHMGGGQGNALPPPPPLLADWPQDACVKYALNIEYGILRGQFGDAEQCWTRDESRYSARLVGSASVLFRSFALQQQSSGRLLGGVLVSDLFAEKFDGRSYDTAFELSTGVLRQTRNGEARQVLAKGLALDMLALMHFMAMQPEDAPPFDVFVVATRGTVSRVTVAQLPLQPLDLPIGTTIARQFRAEARSGELKIDVWIGKTLRNTPVRFRIDNRGDIFDFVATEVLVEGQRLAQQPEQAPTQ